MNGKPPVDIYFSEFLRDDGKVGGGGIGTVISYLCPLLKDAGYSATVYQCYNDVPFESTYRGVPVHGVVAKPGPGRPTSVVVEELHRIAAGRTGARSRIEIYPADFFSLPSPNPLAISMQMGLAWDAPIDLLTRKSVFKSNFGEKVFRLSRQLRGLRAFEHCYNRVVVDLYFLNWYRSFRGIDFPGKVWYNANPAPTIEWDAGRDTPQATADVRLICARRLVPEKGTRILADALSRVLAVRPNIRVTIAGRGSEETFLRQALPPDRVTFTTYPPEHSLEEHRKHDIALIPSVCGEGTSLAIAEAMAAGCAVLATNTGGTITQIIDGHNGLLAWPNADDLATKLTWLIDHPDQRHRMQRRAWEVATECFGVEAWGRRWLEILAAVQEGEEEARRGLARRGGIRNAWRAF